MTATNRLWAGVLLFLVLAGAYVGLTAAQLDVAPLMLLGGPLVTFLLITAQLTGNQQNTETARADQNKVLGTQTALLDTHTTQLATITAQTNGVLDARIREAAGAALIAHLVNATPPADNQPPPTRERLPL